VEGISVGRDKVVWPLVHAGIGARDALVLEAARYQLVFKSSVCGDVVGVVVGAYRFTGCGEDTPAGTA
jgi:hypothetical protein